MLGAGAAGVADEPAEVEAGCRPPLSVGSGVPIFSDFSLLSSSLAFPAEFDLPVLPVFPSLLLGRVLEEDDLFPLPRVSIVDVRDLFSSRSSGTVSPRFSLTPSKA